MTRILTPELQSDTVMITKKVPLFHQQYFCWRRRSMFNRISWRETLSSKNCTINLYLENSHTLCTAWDYQINSTQLTFISLSFLHFLWTKCTNHATHSSLTSEERKFYLTQQSATNVPYSGKTLPWGNFCLFCQKISVSKLPQYNGHLHFLAHTDSLDLCQWWYPMHTSIHTW